MTSDRQIDRANVRGSRESGSETLKSLIRQEQILEQILDKLTILVALEETRVAREGVV